MTELSDEQIEALCERLDRVEYNQGVPKNAPWLTRQGLSSSASWGIHQPLGKFGLFLIIAREVGEPFAEFIAAARTLVPSLLERARKAEAERDDLAAKLRAVEALAERVENRMMELRAALSADTTPEATEEHGERNPCGRCCWPAQCADGCEKATQ